MIELIPDGALKALARFGCIDDYRQKGIERFQKIYSLVLITGAWTNQDQCTVVAFFTALL